MNRRVVTGLDASGKSCVVIDGEIPQQLPIANTIWHTPALPADNAGSADCAPPFGFDIMHGGGSVFLMVRLPPGATSAFHATDTIDYLTIISGEVVLTLETGEVVLRAGDTCVDRGIIHGWRNDGSEDAVYTTVTLPSHPVGAGKTV